jgi:queuine tRNA-ribosyltransferase
MMDWHGPILTDSGGFQVMSLSQLRKLDKDGVTFQSHINGERFRVTPERSIEIQHLLDADITMCFDECTPFPATHEVAAQSMRLSMDWAARSRAAFVERPGYGLFGIQQGSVFEDLRAESARALRGIGFEGYALGGLAVGEGQAEMFRVLDFAVPMLPEEKPRYLMGVGTPGDLIGAVGRGVDMFDCVIPTRSGRTGRAYTSRGVVNIRNARHAESLAPLDPECDCPACTKHSLGYLHHLFKAGEMLGPILLTWHNIRYYQVLMARLRQGILEGRFAAVAEAIQAGWSKTEEVAAA